MRLAPAFVSVVLATCVAARAAEPVTAASLQQQLRTLSINPGESYRVRNLRLRRGDVSIYLNEGVVTFARPVSDRPIAAVFTTVGTEAGDGEILLMPSEPSERASLASFTGSPNLDEHFDSAIFFFSDATANEITRDSNAGMLTKAPEVAEQVSPELDPILQQQAKALESVLLTGLLDAHNPKDGSFLATILGRQLGVFNFLYYPNSFEPVTIERMLADGVAQIWTGYRPRALAPFQVSASGVSDYRLDVSIADDLALATVAQFRYTPNPADGRVISLSLSPRLRVASATVDGQTAEVVQFPADLQAPHNGALNADASLLVIAPEQLFPKTQYQVKIRYAGSVIRRVVGNSYFVGERAVWYPHQFPMLTEFDLTFHYPSRFQLVATGEPAETLRRSDKTTIQHLRTAVPERFAGFNLGQYSSVSSDSANYHIDCYADSSASIGMNGVPSQTAEILAFYTGHWGQLPIHTLAVTPIPGYFGQGFPGLIYLSSLSYVREEDRPLSMRDSRAQTFFSLMLLPHEIAHQWWGNLLTAANYRSSWLTEAMANDGALQFVQQRQGEPGANEILGHFRDDLLHTKNGKPLDSSGPLDFGVRLLQNSGQDVWQTIIYEKGAWVLQMLRQRLGPEGFSAMQKQVLQEYGGRAITNDEFRRAAARFVPAGQPDRDLTRFFETWIYGTGIPKLQLSRSAVGSVIAVSAVEEDFTADLPIHCKARGGREQTRWVPIVSGDNFVRDGANTTCELPRDTEFLYRR